MLKLENIAKHFIEKGNEIHTLSNISFTINEGEIFGIVGKSGVGKSTLLKILSLQLKPDNGNYYLFKNDTNNLNSKELKELVKQTSFIYQDFSLLYNLSVIENVELPLKINGIRKLERKRLALEMLEYIGLSHLEKKYPITLSGGEAQRVSIARALVTNPKILFCDEPTSALDDESAVDILNLIKKIHNEFKPTIVLVSHQIDVIKYLCDRVLLLQDGTINRLDTIKNTTHINRKYIERLWGEE